MKRLLYMLLCGVLAFSFVSCTGESNSSSGEVSPSPVATQNPAEVSPTPVATQNPAEVSPTPVLTPTPDDEGYVAKNEKEQARLDYLKTVTYRRYTLTGDADPYFVGRWFDKTVKEAPHKVTTTAGSHFYFMIENAESFTVEFTAMANAATTPYFSYSIDGATPVRQKITEPTVALPDKNMHTVRIIVDGIDQQTTKWQREIGLAYKQLSTVEGGIISGIRPLNPVIFFYGDSITEGIQALNKNGLTSESNSATNAYSWLTAEKLGAVAYMVGYGASGVTCTGSFTTFANAIDNLSKDRPFDPTILEPDLIVINHGYNDIGSSSSVFQDRLKEALDKLRTLYPEQAIVYMIPLNQSHAADIQEVLATYENTYIVETRGLAISTTDGTHPSRTGALTVAGRLSTELKRIFGESYFQ